MLRAPEGRKEANLSLLPLKPCVSADFFLGPPAIGALLSFLFGGRVPLLE